MSDTWIGRILLTDEDGVYTKSHAKVLNLDQCDGSAINASTQPNLASIAERGTVEYTGIAPSIASSTRGITTNGLHYYILSASGIVRQYSTDWVATGVTYSVAAQTAKTSALLWDGVHFWVVAETHKKLYQYLPGFVYTGLVKDMSYVGDYPQGMAYDGLNYWVSASNKLHQLDPNLDPTGVEYGLRDSGSAGVVIFGGFFWVQDYGRDRLYQYYLDGGRSGPSIYNGDYTTLAFAVGPHHSGDGFYLCGFSGARNAFWYTGDPTRPTMIAPAGSGNPYKIIGDLVWEQIGDTISTGSDKIRGKSGDYEFDALLNDGSAVDPNTHPQLHAIMQTLPNDTQPASPNQPFKTVADLT